MPADPPAENPVHQRLLRQFSYEHLSKEMQMLSVPFAAVAERMVSGLPGMDLHPADVTVALRKLLEAKDAFVRSALP